MQRPQQTTNGNRVSAFQQPPPPAKVTRQQADEDDDEGEDYENGDFGDYDDEDDAMETNAPPASKKPVNHLSDQKFADLAKSGLISAPTAKAITETMGFEFLTIVQAATLKHLLTGADCLAQAKTGTGKTLAFLIPSIETLLRAQKANGGRPPPQNNISVLVLSPTRELAMQIAGEAEILLKHYAFKVQCVYGGTNINSEANRLKSQRADILVATPGRLLDHLQNGAVAQMCSNLRVLILDEADRLLDQGFARELHAIFKLLPDRNRTPRQTLLFSATVPQEVKQIAKEVLLSNHTFIQTIPEDSIGTAENVTQKLLVVPVEDQFSTTLALLQVTIKPNKSEMQRHPNAYKVLAFFTTARSTQLAAELFSEMRLFPSWEIHSRKSQGQRTKAMDAFKNAQCGVLFSSDVSARGIDVEGITLVLQVLRHLLITAQQVGLPASREQYIHRLGRTARAGAAGEGILILAPFETFFAERKVRDLPLQKITIGDRELAAARVTVSNAMRKVSSQTKGQCYSAHLGFYNSSLRDLRWSKEQLVAHANEYALNVLLYGSIPPIPKKTVGMMGLRGTPGLNIVNDIRDVRGGGGGGGGGNNSRKRKEEGAGGGANGGNPRSPQQPRPKQTFQNHANHPQQQQQHQQQRAPAPAPIHNHHQQHGGNLNSSSAFPPLSAQQQQNQQRSPAQQHQNQQRPQQGGGGGGGRGGQAQSGAGAARKPSHRGHRRGGGGGGGGGRADAHPQ